MNQVWLHKRTKLLANGELLTIFGEHIDRSPIRISGLATSGDRFGKGKFLNSAGELGSFSLKHSTPDQVAAEYTFDSFEHYAYMRPTMTHNECFLAGLWFDPDVAGVSVENSSSGELARTKDFLDFIPKVATKVTIDVDFKDATEVNALEELGPTAPKTPQEAYDLLMRVVPEWRKHGVLAFESSSGGVCLPDGTPLKASTNFRLEMFTTDASLVPDILNLIHMRCFGLGICASAFVSRSSDAPVAIHLRSLADLALGVPTQPDFLAPLLKGGLTQTRNWTLWRGVPITSVPVLTPFEEQSADRNMEDLRGRLQPIVDKLNDETELRLILRKMALGVPEAEARQQVMERFRPDVAALYSDDILISGGESKTVGEWAAMLGRSANGRGFHHPNMHGDSAGETRGVLYWPSHDPSPHIYTHGGRSMRFEFPDWGGKVDEPFFSRPVPEHMRQETIEHHAVVIASWFHEAVAAIRASKAVSAGYEAVKQSQFDAAISDLPKDDEALGRSMGAALTYAREQGAEIAANWDLVHAHEISDADKMAVRRRVQVEMDLDFLPSTRVRKDLQLGVRGTMGVGKTALLVGREDAPGLLQQATGLVTLVVLPRLNKVQEASDDFKKSKDLFNGGPPHATVSGRNALTFADTSLNPDASDRMCKFFEVADAVSDKRGAVPTTMCAGCSRNQDENRLCEYLDEQDEIRRLAAGPDGVVLFVTHDFLTVPLCGGDVIPDLIIVDEKLRELLESAELAEGEIEEFRSTKMGEVDALDRDIAVSRLEAITDGQDVVIHPDTITWLKDRLEASLIASTRDFEDDQGGAIKAVKASEAVHLAKILMFFEEAENAVNIQPNQKCFRDGETFFAHVVTRLKGFRYPGVPILLLDGSASERISGCFFGQDIEWSVLKVSQRAHITQVVGRSFQPSALAKTKGVADDIASVVSTYPEPVIFAPKKTLELLDKVKVSKANFGAIRGMNVWQDKQSAFIVGDLLPPFPVVTSAGLALRSALDLPRPDPDLPDRWIKENRGIAMKDGSVFTTATTIHPDPIAQEYLESERESEAVQALAEIGSHPSDTTHSTNGRSRKIFEVCPGSVTN